jgi:hypothetical protein
LQIHYSRLFAKPHTLSAVITLYKNSLIYCVTRIGNIQVFSVFFSNFFLSSLLSPHSPFCIAISFRIWPLKLFRDGTIHFYSYHQVRNALNVVVKRHIFREVGRHQFTIHSTSIANLTLRLRLTHHSRSNLFLSFSFTYSLARMHPPPAKRLMIAA